MKNLIILTSLLALWGCGSSQKIVQTPILEEPLEIRTLDTLVVTAPATPSASDLVVDTLPIYRASSRRTVDLIHTDLDLQFDWNQELVLGTAELHLLPYNLPVDEVTLDAKNFTWENVLDLRKEKELTYQYDDRRISIKLSQTHQEGDTISLKLVYIARPAAGSSASAAITSDRGLFFINGDGSDPSKPRQIWTQGETEFNSNWFPTIDRPNERQTHSITLTVDNQFTTLSNGDLVSSEMLPDGKRRDRWVMDQPHAPYLTMLGIGEFAVVNDPRSHVPVDYYVEKEYKDDAAAIFAHTPEMIRFFESLTGVAYPWSKYSQIVVRDYVSGAMENTSAVIYGQQVQRHKRELIDDNNDYIVAHELIHHWFGNLVTCESWSNLTLNEGFANYGEYLWFEHKYGLDHAEHHRLQQLDEYLYEAQTKRHPLIDFRYEDKEDMFDAHSYNKGGLVLHMLRRYLGDEMFFESWKEYLESNAYQAVEVHHLRLAVEKVSGEDMNWFFNQWFLHAGHPELSYDFDWDPDKELVSLEINQTQKASAGENLAVYRIPLKVLVLFAGGQQTWHNIELDARYDRFTFPAHEVPIAVILDPEQDILAEIQHLVAPDLAHHLYSASNPYVLRDLAVERLAGGSSELAIKALASALEDPFWEIRRKALNYMNWEEPGTPVSKLLALAESDPHSKVRADAMMVLALIAPRSSTEILIKSINNHDPYTVVGAAISGLYQVDPQRCVELIKSLKSENQVDIVAAISGIYAQIKDVENLNYFDSHRSSVSGFPALTFYTNFQRLLSQLPGEAMLPWLEKCAESASDPAVNPYARIGAMRVIITLMKEADDLNGLEKNALESLVQQVLTKESNEEILSIYQTLLGS